MVLSRFQDQSVSPKGGKEKEILIIKGVSLERQYGLKGKYTQWRQELPLIISACSYAHQPVMLLLVPTVYNKQGINYNATVQRENAM